MFTAEISMGSVDLRDGSDRVENSVNLFSSVEKFMRFNSDPNFSNVHVNSSFLCPIHGVLFCCSLCVLLVHVIFTRLYYFKYKFNNMGMLILVF